MFQVWIYTLISVFVVSLISLIGVVTLSLQYHYLKKILLYLVSFSAGALLADVFVHLLPEVFEDVGFPLQVSLYLLLGLFFPFIIEKFLHWHHCHHVHTEKHVHPFAIINLVGDLVHNFLDGLVIAVSYLVSIPVGLATTIAVIFHEIPQEIGDFAVLLHGGFSKGRALFLNFVTALSAILGAVLALLISQYFTSLTIFLIPFAAGNFIYIAAADLIPELHKEVNLEKSLYQIIGFLLGVLVMLLLLFLE